MLFDRNDRPGRSHLSDDCLPIERLDGGDIYDMYPDPLIPHLLCREHRIVQKRARRKDDRLRVLCDEEYLCLPNLKWGLPQWS